jgi:hypothetical protein
MSKQSIQFRPVGFGFQAARIVNADGTTSKVVYPAGSNDSIIDALFITSTDTSPQNVQIIINDGTNDNIIDTIPVPAGSGTDGTHATIDALSAAGHALNGNAKKVILLKAGCILKAAMLAAVTSAKLVTVSACAEDY